MPFPAVRIGVDQHVCPMVTGVVPHVGGPIVGPGAATVLIGSIPAAVMGDNCVCVGPPATIVMGSPTVFFMGKMAARLTSQTAHGGLVVGPGMPNVLIGP